MLVDEIAHHERGRLEPGDAPDRGEVGPQREVAVAEVPVREAVAGQRRHVGVDREEVVAGVQLALAPPQLLEPVVPGHALAKEPALQVGEHHEDGVDAPHLDLVGELVRPNHPRHRHPVEHRWDPPGVVSALYTALKRRPSVTRG